MSFLKVPQKNERQKKNPKYHLGLLNLSKKMLSVKTSVSVNTIPKVKKEFRAAIVI